MADINQTSVYAFFNKPIRDGNGIITDTNRIFVELHATTQVSINNSSTAPDIPIRTGETISDDLIKKPTMVNFTGRITSFANSRIVGAPFVTENGLGTDSDDAIVLLLNNMIREKVVANVVVKSEGGRTETIPRCVLTSFARSRSTESSNGWEVSLQFKQLLLTRAIDIEQVELLIQRPDDDFIEQAQEVDTQGTSPTAPRILTPEQLERVRLEFNDGTVFEEPSFVDSLPQGG